MLKKRKEGGPIREQINKVLVPTIGVSLVLGGLCLRSDELPIVTSVENNKLTLPHSLDTTTSTFPELYEAAQVEEVAKRIDPPVTTAATTTSTTEAPLPPPENYEIWIKIAQCESNLTWDINTGNGFYGGLQFTLTSWKGAGGLEDAARPDLATPLQQINRANILKKMQGWGAWPACARKLGLL